MQSKQQAKPPVVLVVDDNENHHRLLELMAERLGINVHCKLSCKHALDALEEARYHLILMDYRMPEVDGCMCAKKIRASSGPHKRVPIIGVTALTHPTAHLECLEAGMNDFLPKPFSLSQLEEKIRSLIEDDQRKDDQRKDE